MQKLQEWPLEASCRCRVGKENSSEVKPANKAWRKCNLRISTAPSPAQMAAAHWTSVSPMKWDHELLFGNARVTSDEVRRGAEARNGSPPVLRNCAKHLRLPGDRNMFHSPNRFQREKAFHLDCVLVSQILYKQIKLGFHLGAQCLALVL